MSECKSCDAGSVASQKGQEICKVCDAGTSAENATRCEPCSPGSVGKSKGGCSVFVFSRSSVSFGRSVVSAFVLQVGQVVRKYGKVVGGCWGLLELC